MSVPWKPYFWAWLSITANTFTPTHKESQLKMNMVQVLNCAGLDNQLRLGGKVCRCTCISYYEDSLLRILCLES